MQSVTQLIVSGISAAALVLASCVMVAPLWAVLVAAGCVAAAWMVMYLGCVERGTWASGLGERVVRNGRSDR